MSCWSEVPTSALGWDETQTLGFSATQSLTSHPSHPYGYPGSQPITTVMIANGRDRRLLGAQMAGAAVVGKRIDILACALHARMKIDHIGRLDLVYAPPISPLHDPVLTAAGAMSKALSAAGAK